MRRWLLLAVFLLTLSVTVFTVHNRSKIKRFIYNRKLNIIEESIDSSNFYKLINIPATPWMINRIQKDLHHYKRIPITRKKLDRTYRALQHTAIARFQMRGTHLTYQTTCKDNVRFLAMRDGLEKLTQLYPYLNVDFIVSLEENIDLKDAPVFVFAKNIYNPAHILIPDFTCFAKKSTSESWTYSLKPRVEKAALEVPWDRRIEQVMWRGATTGIEFKQGLVATSGRCKLCAMSKYHPNQIDAKFTDLVEVPPTFEHRFKEEFPIDSFITPEQHLYYKYLIAVDGNTCSYPGLHWRLMSGSLLLKQDSDYIQWYYEGLKPGYHYLPVEKDLANLLPRIEWAKQHDYQAKEIANHAKEFAEENLSQESIYRYLCLLLREYQKVYLTSHLAIDIRTRSNHP